MKLWAKTSWTVEFRGERAEKPSWELCKIGAVGRKTGAYPLRGGERRGMGKEDRQEGKHFKA